MAIWKCESCGFTKDSRCKPKKCESCAWVNFSKKEEETKSCKCTGCGCKK